MKKILFWYLLSITISIIAIIYLLNKGLSYWESFLIVLIPSIISYIEGIVRGKYSIKNK